MIVTAADDMEIGDGHFSRGHGPRKYRASDEFLAAVSMPGTPAHASYWESAFSTRHMRIQNADFNVSYFKYDDIDIYLLMIMGPRRLRLSSDFIYLLEASRR